jgi:hypothetical protein
MSVRACKLTTRALTVAPAHPLPSSRRMAPKSSGCYFTCECKSNSRETNTNSWRRCADATLFSWDFNTLFRKICWLTLFLEVAGWVGFTIGAAAIQWPLHYYVGDTAVIQTYNYGIHVWASVLTTAIVNIVLDVWVLLLPIPKLYSLTAVSDQKKVG